MIDNFVFRKEWHDVLKGCSPEVRQEVYEAIMAYAFEDCVVEMGDMARMAFAFIRPQIDAMRDKYRAKCEQNRANASGRNQSPANANDGKQTQPNASDGSDSEPYNNNNNDNINNNISLSFEEREKIFEIFYFERNLITAKEECEKFINHYEANGWCRGNSDKPIKNKSALAKSWKVEREEKRYPDNVMAWLHEIYLQAREDGKPAEVIISGIERIMEENGKPIVVCNRIAYQLCEMYSQKVGRNFELSYRVRREA